VNAPELFAVALALPAPLNVTIAPFPPAEGMIVPDRLNVGGGGVCCEVWETRPEHPPIKTSGASSVNNLDARPFANLILRRSISLIRDIIVPPYAFLQSSASRQHSE
jgi:hypothetical protein